MKVLSFRPIDDLQATLIASRRDVSRATHRFLALLRNGDAEASVRDAKRLHESRSLWRQFREDGSGQ